MAITECSVPGTKHVIGILSFTLHNLMKLVVFCLFADGKVKHREV